MTLDGIDLDTRCTSVREDMGQLYFACAGPALNTVGITIVSDTHPNYIAARAWAVSNGHIQQEKSA